jgi:phosphogluconate dehydratase
MHLIAMARAIGLTLTWQDMEEISAITPQLARIYPNGVADVNQFETAGGFAFVARELLAAGVLHGDAATAWGGALETVARTPHLHDGQLIWRAPPAKSGDESVLVPVARAFAPEGGIRVLQGNLGRAVVKLSAVSTDHWQIEAPAIVFDSQAQFEAAFGAGRLDTDFVAVLRFQGPRANGMPELHKLVPLLGVLQDRGKKVALLTDGRMSGASGKVLAGIHVTPEAACGGALAKIVDGDRIRLDARYGAMDIMVAAEVLAARPAAALPDDGEASGMGRELFGGLRRNASPADEGASILV